MSEVIEGLERRELLSVAVKSHGKLVEIIGTRAADVITVEVKKKKLFITDNGEKHQVDIPRTVVIRSHGRNDEVKLTSRATVLRKRIAVTVYAGKGHDTVSMTGGAFFGGLIGEKGNDVLTARTTYRGNANALFGDSGNDKLIGSVGHDLFYGGSGKDTMKGGGGRDEFKDFESRDDTKL